jgi:hypothetical protein
MLWLVVFNFKEGKYIYFILLIYLNNNINFYINNYFLQFRLRLKGVVSRHSHQAAVRNGKKSKANKQKSSSSLGMLA